MGLVPQRVVEPMTLEELFDHGAKFAEASFGKFGRIFPTWIGYNENGEFIPVVAMFADDNDKDNALAMTRKAFADGGAYQYVTMVETWLLKGSKGEIPAEVLAGEAAVSEQPNKEEALWIMAEDNLGNHIAGFFMIQRDMNGKPTLSPLEKFPSGLLSSGRFTNLLPETKSTEH